MRCDLTRVSGSVPKERRYSGGYAMGRRTLQRTSTKYGSNTMARRRRRETLHSDSKGRPPGTYRCSSDTAYRLPMSDTSTTPEDWAGYLLRMTKRDGWSVQRLADESGVHRSRLF